MDSLILYYKLTGKAYAPARRYYTHSAAVHARSLIGPGMDIVGYNRAHEEVWRGLGSPGLEITFAPRLPDHPRTTTVRRCPASERMGAEVRKADEALAKRGIYPGDPLRPLAERIEELGAQLDGAQASTRDVLNRLVTAKAMLEIVPR